MPEGHFINDYVAINYSKNDKDDLVHFLTHIETGARTEDLKDLLSSTASTIFTSSVNAHILKVHFKYEQNITPIEMGKSYQIYTKNRKMFIFTCLRSYYNCGSMILIARGDFGTVIYTGFCAIDFNSLNVPIVKEIIRQRSLSKLYLDCTYYKNYLEFFSISDIKKVLVQFFRSRKNRFYIHVPIFGLEDLLGHIAMILEEVMVVDEKRMTLIQFLGLSEHFTLDKTKGRLHVISQGIMKRNNENETSQLVYIKVVNELSHNSNSYMNHGKIHFFTIYPHCTNKDCTDIINNTRPDSLIQIGSTKSLNSSNTSTSAENVMESSNNSSLSAENNKEARSHFVNYQTGKTAIKVLNRNNQSLTGNVSQKVLANKKSRKRSSDSFTGNVQFKISDCTPSVSSKKKKNEVKSLKTPGINLIEYESKVENDAQLEEKLKQLVSKINNKYFKNKMTNNLGLKSKKIAEYKSLLQSKRKKYTLSSEESINEESLLDKEEDQGKGLSPEPIVYEMNGSANETTESDNECINNEESEFATFVEHPYAMSPQKANLMVSTSQSKPRILKTSKNIFKSKIENLPVTIKHVDREEIMTKCVSSPKKDLNNLSSNKPDQNETAQPIPNKTNEDDRDIMLKKNSRTVSQEVEQKDEELRSEEGVLELRLSEESQSICDSPQIENESLIKNKARVILGSGLVKINTDVSKCNQFIPILINKNSGFPNSSPSKLVSGKEMPKIVVKLTKNSDSCTSVTLSNLKCCRPINEPNVLANLPECNNFCKHSEKQKLNAKVTLPESPDSCSLQTLLQAPTKTSLLSMDSSKVGVQIKGALIEKSSEHSNKREVQQVDSKDLLLPQSSSLVDNVKIKTQTSLKNNEFSCSASEKIVLTNPIQAEGSEEDLPTNDGINNVDLLIPTKFKLSDIESSSSFTVEPEIQCDLEKNGNLIPNFTKPSLSKSSLNQEMLEGSIEAGAKVHQPRLPTLGRSTSLVMEKSDTLINRPIVTGLENPDLNDLNNRSPVANEKLVLSTKELSQNNGLEDDNRVQHCLPSSDATSNDKEKDHSSLNIFKPLISCKFINEQDLKSINQETLKGAIEAAAKVQQPKLPILGRSTLLIKENSDTSVNRPVVTGFENPDLSNRSPSASEKVRLMLIKSKSSYCEPPSSFTDESEVETNTLGYPKGPVLGKIESVGTLIPLDKMAFSEKAIDPSLLNESQLCINEKLVLPTMRKLMPIKRKFGRPPPLTPIERLPKIVPSSPSSSSSSPTPLSSPLKKGVEVKGVPTTKINVASSNILGTLKKICGKGTGIMNYSNEKVFLTKNSIIIPSHLIRSPPLDPGPSNKELFGSKPFISNGIKYIQMSKNKLSNIISSLEGKLNQQNVQHIVCQTEQATMSSDSVIELSDDSQNSVHDETQPPEKNSLCPLVISIKDVKESVSNSMALEQKGILLDHKRITSTSRLKVKNLSELLSDPSLAQLMTSKNPSEDSIISNPPEESITTNIPDDSITTNSPEDSMTTYPSEDSITTNPSENSITKNPIEASAVNDIEPFEPGSVLNTNQINVNDEVVSWKNEIYQPTTGKEMSSDVINCSTSFSAMNKNSDTIKKSIGRRRRKRKKSIWLKNINPKRRAYKWKINDPIGLNRSVCVSTLNNTLSNCFSSSDPSFTLESTSIKDMGINDLNNTMFDSCFKENTIVDILPDNNNSSNQIRVAANIDELLTNLNRTEIEQNLLKQFGICGELIICIKQDLEDSSGYKYDNIKKCYMQKKRRGRPPKLDRFKKALSTSDSDITLPLDSKYSPPPTLKPFYEEDDLEFQDCSRSLMEELRFTAKEHAEKKWSKSPGALSAKQSDFKTSVRRNAPLLSRYDQIPNTKLRRKKRNLTPFVDKVESPSNSLTDFKDNLDIEVSVTNNENEEEELSNPKRSYKRRNKKPDLVDVNSYLGGSQFSTTSYKEEKSISPDMDEESPPNLVPEVIGKDNESLTSERLTLGDVDNCLHSISHEGLTLQEDLDHDSDSLPNLEKSTEISFQGCEELPQQNVDIPPSLEVLYDTSKSSYSGPKNPDQSIEKVSNNLCLPPQSAVSDVSKDNNSSVDNADSSHFKEDSLSITSTDETNQKKTLRSRKRMNHNEYDQNNSKNSSSDSSLEEMDPLKSSVEQTTPSDILSHVKNCFQYFSRPSSFGRKRKIHPKLLKSSCYMLSHLTSKQSQIKEINSSLNMEKRPQTPNTADESAIVHHKISELSDDIPES